MNNRTVSSPTSSPECSVHHTAVGVSTLKLANSAIDSQAHRRFEECMILVEGSLHDSDTAHCLYIRVDRDGPRRRVGTRLVGPPQFFCSRLLKRESHVGTQVV